MSRCQLIKPPQLGVQPRLPNYVQFLSTAKSQRYQFARSQQIDPSAVQITVTTASNKVVSMHGTALQTHQDIPQDDIHRDKDGRSCQWYPVVERCCFTGGYSWKNLKSAQFWTALHMHQIVYTPATHRQQPEQVATIVNLIFFLSDRLNKATFLPLKLFMVSETLHALGTFFVLSEVLATNTTSDAS